MRSPLGHVTRSGIPGAGVPHCPSGMRCQRSVAVLTWVRSVGKPRQGRQEDEEGGDGMKKTQGRSVSVFLRLWCPRGRCNLSAQLFHCRAAAPCWNAGRCACAEAAGHRRPRRPRPLLSSVCWQGDMCPPTSSFFFFSPC